MVTLFGGLPPTPQSSFGERVRLQKSMFDMASGTKLNSASDDPAGMAQAIDLDKGLRGLRQANRNTFDAMAVTQTAEGGLQGVTDALTRLRELAVQAASDTLSPEQRGILQTEIDGITQQIDQLAGSTEFNGINLLDGTAGTLQFQVGENASPDDVISFATPEINSAGLGVDTASVATSGDAQALIDAVDNAISQVATEQASIGATTNQLQATADNLQTAIVNTSAGLSQIADTDYGKASSDFASGMVQQQAAISIQVQANAQQMAVLKLLG
jgi:flagellin